MTFAQIREGLQAIADTGFIPEDADQCFVGAKYGYIGVAARKDDFDYRITASHCKDGTFKVSEGDCHRWHPVV